MKKYSNTYEFNPLAFDKINNKAVLTKAKTIFNTYVHVIFFTKHYGFTNKELGFIINYDIKYRMGLG